MTDKELKDRRFVHALGILVVLGVVMRLVQIDLPENSFHPLAIAGTIFILWHFIKSNRDFPSFDPDDTSIPRFFEEMIPIGVLVLVAFICAGAFMLAGWYVCDYLLNYGN